MSAAHAIGVHLEAELVPTHCRVERPAVNEHICSLAFLEREVLYRCHPWRCRVERGVAQPRGVACTVCLISEAAQPILLSLHRAPQLSDGCKGCSQVLVLQGGHVLCQESPPHPRPAAQSSEVARHLLLRAQPEVCLHLSEGHSCLRAPVGADNREVAAAGLLDMFVGVPQLPYPAAPLATVDTVHPQVLDLPVVELVLEGAACKRLAADWAGLLVLGLLQAFEAEEVATAGEHGAVQQVLADGADQVFTNLAHKLEVHSFVGQSGP